jgi:hypothetical protein
MINIKSVPDVGCHAYEFWIPLVSVSTLIFMVLLCDGVVLHTWSSFSDGVLETIWKVFLMIVSTYPISCFQADLQFHLDSHVSQLQ